MAVQNPIRQAQRADADYARLAPVYDEATRWIDLARMTAIDRLAPQPGETVADMACGTGFCLPALVQAVGPAGTLNVSLLQRFDSGTPYSAIISVPAVASPSAPADIRSRYLGEPLTTTYYIGERGRFDLRVRHRLVTRLDGHRDGDRLEVLAGGGFPV